MKKLLSILLLLTVVACTDDIEFLGPDLNSIEVPENLQISDAMGLKLESTIVSDEVSMNVKLPYSGTYRIKIKDISNELISQEKINGDEGNNLLKVYVSNLPKSSYTLILTDYDHKVLGITTIVVN